MGTPLVSVIIPAYNAEGTILETIASVRAQSHANLEILVIDDGSTDATVARVRSVDDPRLRVFPYPHAGLAAARNRGFERSTGAFVSFIDADDLWTQDKLTAQLDALERHPEAGLAYSWTIFVDPDGHFLFAKERLYFEGDVRLPLLRECFIASGSNVLLRRRCVESVGPFHGEAALRSAEDWDYWLRAAVAWPFAVVPRYQILYRVWPGSMTSDVEGMESACLAVLERALACAPDDLRRRRREYQANVKHYASFLHLTRSPRGERRKVAGRKLLEAIRLHPAIVARRKTFVLLCTWTLLGLVPRALAPRAMTALLRLHGRIMALLVPELREGTIAARR
jgi:glycosyltransferase involved in cell wall biosynthesis